MALRPLRHMAQQVAVRSLSSGSSTAVGAARACSSVTTRLQEVLGKVDAASAQGGTETAAAKVRLVAVSKTKPVELLQEAYASGHRHFGENYVQELVEKAPLMPDDVEWHFIGKLQTNKVNKLVKGCTSLSCLETVDSEKLAQALNRAWLAVHADGRKLKVMVQVNTSGEGSKNGVRPDESCVKLCSRIAREFTGLHLAGLMTIGAPDYSGCRIEDFEALKKCRREVATAIGVDVDSLELSMGMSNDYENAIQQGSTSVRVGSSIFGARQYPAAAKA
mmetsp:Transcript_104508/g.184350  ORF Transcript_104508/g.184350 Transcript_104508/m.184350 type:complete len:277 (+) Transcript_104508:39-869(+)